MIKTFSNTLIWSFPLAYFPWQCRCSSDFTMICLAAALILIGIFSFKASKWHARSIENLTVNRSEYKNIYGQRGNRMREEKMIVHKSFINGHLHWTCGSQLNEHTLRNDIDNEEVFKRMHSICVYTTSIDQLRFIFKWNMMLCLGEKQHMFTCTLWWYMVNTIQCNTQYIRIAL